MWSVRILSGPQAGQFIDLKMGRNLVGRSPQCEVKILSQGVSKEHCEIHVYKEKIMIVDLRSSNGTFVNGVRIQNGIIRLGDKISIHDVLLDIMATPDIRPQTRSPQTTQGAPAPLAVGPHPYSQSQPPYSLPNPMYPPGFQGNAALNMQPQMMDPQMMGMPSPSAMMPPESTPSSGNAMMTQGFFKGLSSNFQDYMERVALPGVYKLAQWADFKMILAGFIAVFIFSVTLLSMFPMMQITKDSIMAESMRRASSLAKTMAEVNQQNILQGNFTAMSTHLAETEEGVKQAFIIQQSDGMIVAPASRAGRTPDIAFVHKARKEPKSSVAVIDSNTIGASYPIGLYDPNTGEPSVKAHAVVIYDVSSLAFDTGRAISLFMQTLLIASLVGLLIFYFMYHLIEYPVRVLNDKLDLALREKSDNIALDFQFPIFQNLVGNVNSLLTRVLHGSSEMQSSHAGSGKEGEAENLVQLMMLPCAAIHSMGHIISCNSRFEQFARSTKDQIQGQQISALGDISLQQNIEHLLKKTKENPYSIHSDQLEFSGQPCHIHCQAFTTQGQIDYFMIVITPSEGGSE